MNKSIHHRKYIAGLSLIELMVALAVSAIMLLGVTTVYTASKRSYQINTEMTKIQENARFALHRLTNEIRMAGYTGCQNIDAIRMNVLSRPPPAGFSNLTTSDANTPDYSKSSFNLNSYVTGHTYNGGNWTPPFEAGLRPTNFVAGSDAITIRKLSACSARVINNNGNSLNVQGNCNFNPGDVVVVADCTHADMFTITGGNPTTLNYNGPANAPNTLSGKEGKYIGANVFKADAVVYYIGQDNNVPPNVDLWTNRLVNFNGVYVPRPSILIPNVQDMVITYGLDTDGDPGFSVDTEMFAGAIGNNMALIQNAITTETNENRPSEVTVTSPWSRVVRVNLQLLLASDPVGTTLRPFTFDGVNYNDTRSRRVFNTSINIRARTP